MFKAIKNLIEDKKREKESKKRDRDIIKFTVRNIDTKEEKTIIMDRLGYNNYMVYSYLDNIELVNAEVIKRA